MINLLKKHIDFNRNDLLKKIIVLIVSAILLYVFVQSFGKIYARPQDGEFFVPQVSSESILLEEESVLIQKFISPVNNLQSLYLYFDASETMFSTMYLVTIFDSNGEFVAQNDFKTDQVSSPVNVLLAPIKLIKGEEYTMEIKLVRTTDNSAAKFIFMQDTAGFENAVLDGANLNSSLAVQVNNEPLNQVSTYIVVLIFAFLSIAAILFLSGKNIVANTFLFIIIVGVFISVLNPIGDVPDEYAHALRAQGIAQGKIFSYSDTIISSDVNIANIMTMGSQQSNTFARFSDAHLYDIKTGETFVDTTAGTAGNYFFAGYIATALGVKIGTLFSLPVMITVYLSRFLNVICYALLGATCVSLAPSFKKLFSFIACFPLTIFLSASFSPDAITVGLGLISVAYFMKLRDKESGTVKWKETAVWFVITSVMASIRVPYIVMLCLILFLPKNAYKHHKGKLQTAMQFLCAVGVVVLWSYFSGLKGLRVANGSDAGAQIQFLLSNFYEAINIVIGTIFNEIYILVQGFFYLGWNTYNFSWMIIFLPFLLMHIAQSEVPNGKTQKPTHYIYLITVLVVLATYIGMYVTSNAVGIPFVLGIQGRYFLALLSLLPLALSQFAKGKKYGITIL